ncbi:MAG TPA: cytochrome c biogenesis protein/redoxin, partial [Candidatus Limnocylindria bacterium]|nr:cytochrome c biogenesis protein/redoxin [Candidatus Limnocylindria bacterium]
MIGTLGLAFLGGLLSCVSVCFLPLIPAYITYLGGRAVGQPGVSPRGQQLIVLGNALLFIAGFSTVFILFGAAAGLLGANLTQYRSVLLKVAGFALIVMGIGMVGALPWLMREFHVDIAHRLPRTPWASYVVGMAFAVGWTPCVGPILAAILVIAADSATAGMGALLLAAYSAGLAIPLLIAAGLAGQLTRLVRKAYSAGRVLNGIAAVFLISMGLLVFSNRLTLLNSYLPYFTPPLQGLGTSSTSSILAKSDPVTGNGQVQVGKPAPAFTATDLDGHRVSLADLKGRPVLINFWATWCTPCREELPLIESAYRAYRDQGFTVVAVDYKESVGPVRKFWTDLHLEPPPILDPDGRIADAYGV